MKRFLAFMIILILCASAVSFSVAEDAPDVYSYDFDLRFHMNADVFPARNRSHMQGYADLLNSLELKGNLTYCSSTDSFDLNVQIIPVSNPDASVSFKLYGIPEHMGMTSPLLGNESIWFQNYVLMEFAYKTWNNLRIPLQYVTLLYPYVTKSAFDNLSGSWNSHFASVRNGGKVSPQELISLADDWSEILRTDSRLKYWIYSLSLPAEQGNVVEDEFFHLPDYIAKQASLGCSLNIVSDDQSEIWTDQNQNTLYYRTSDNGHEEWTLSLPVTENGYSPNLSYYYEINDNRYSLLLNGSYTLAADRLSGNSSLPESLFSISMEMTDWPCVWPMDSCFTASLRIGGIIYPNTDLKIRGAASRNGTIELVFSQPVGSNDTTEVLTCSGSIVPVSPLSVPSYTLADFSSHLAIFNVNDLTMDDFVHRVRRPLFFGILNFLNELPATACQSVMDDLEDYGVLDMVLID